MLKGNQTKPNHKWPLQAFKLFWASCTHCPKSAQPSGSVQQHRPPSCHGGRHSRSCPSKELQEFDPPPVWGTSLPCVCILGGFSPHGPCSTAIFSRSFHFDAFSLLFSSRQEISFLFLLGNFSFLSISIVTCLWKVALVLFLFFFFKEKKIPGHFAWTGAPLFTVCGSLVVVFNMNPRVSIAFHVNGGGALLDVTGEICGWWTHRLTCLNLCGPAAVKWGRGLGLYVVSRLSMEGSRKAGMKGALDIVTVILWGAMFWCGRVTL